MDFTREPIIETIITPKEGYKLVIRSITSEGQEEYLVDAVEIVSFGDAQFFRSLEKPKAFLVPVKGYEVIEVREARMVLKNVGLDRSIKIGGGRESQSKSSKEQDRSEAIISEERVEQEEPALVSEIPSEPNSELRVDKKRDRRRHYRKRRGREEGGKEEVVEGEVPTPVSEEQASPKSLKSEIVSSQETAVTSANVFSSLLQPPPTLISETINRYRQNDLFKAAFYLSEDEQYKPHDQVEEILNEDDEENLITEEPLFDSEELLENLKTSEIENGQGEELSVEDKSLSQQEENPDFTTDNNEDEFETGSKGELDVNLDEVKEQMFHQILPIYAEEEDVSMGFKDDTDPKIDHVNKEEGEVKTQEEEKES